jgi:repressor LexA
MLTDKQKHLYTIIKEFMEQFKYSPSIRELCELYGVSSPATILHHLRNLRELGIIDFQDGKSRTIVLR